MAEEEEGEIPVAETELEKPVAEETPTDEKIPTEEKRAEKTKENTPNKQKPQKVEYERQYHQPKCNLRLEEISKPRKYLVLDSYKLFNYILDEYHRENLARIIHEEFALSPEEAVDYFKEERALQQKWKEFRKRKVLLRKREKAIQIAKLRKQSVLYVKRVVKKLIMRAYFQPVQIIMSDRLRNISNALLIELCELKHIEVPCREDDTFIANFLFCLCDYFAAGIESLFFELEMKKRKEYDRIIELQNEYANMQNQEGESMYEEN